MTFSSAVRGPRESVESNWLQIAPYVRTDDRLPASFAVPIIRDEPKRKLVACDGRTLG